MWASMKTSSRPTDTATRIYSLHRQAGALFALGLLALAGGWILTMITGEWSFAVFFAIAATVPSLAGWTALGYSERLIMSMWRERNE